MKRWDELTGLRAVAVAMVIFGHSRLFWGAWGDFYLSPFQLLRHGEHGVQIFFVLSGFLITNHLLNEYRRTQKIDFGSFYLKRTLRIFPAFYFLIAFVGVMSVIGYVSVPGRLFVLAGAYVWNYAHFFGWDLPVDPASPGFRYFGHFWSLALEEQFYWFWPGLFWWILKRNSSALLTGIILTVPLIRMASYVLMPSTRGQLMMMLHTGIDSILIGCFFAVHQERIMSRFPMLLKSRWVLSLLAIGVLLVLPNLVAPLKGYWVATYGSTLESFLIGFLILSAIAQPGHWFCWLMRSAPFRFIGTISYSLYLWQQLFCQTDLPIFLGFPLNIAGAIGAATISYFLIERPFLALKDRIHASRPPAIVGREATAAGYFATDPRGVPD